MPLTGATIYETDGLIVTIGLTALQRAAAIALSGTPGGDGGSLVFDVQAAALRDIAGNFNEDHFGLFLLEHQDIIPPVIINAIIDYNDGTLIVNNTDIIDVTPTSRVIVDRLRFKNASDSSNFVNLDGAIVTASDDSTITLSITEEDRSLSIQFSGTSGGDTTAALLDVLAGAYTDIGLVETPLQTEIVLEEIADTVKPVPNIMIVNFTDGTGTLSASETLDVTPTSNMDTSKFVLRGTNDPNVPVSFGSSSVVATDGTTISFTISEQERVDAIKLTSHDGGHNIPILRIQDNAMRDNAINFNVDIAGVQFNSSADILRPSLDSVHVDYNDGLITFTASETMLAELTNLNNLNIRSESYNENLVGSVVYNNTGIANAPLYVKMSEYQRSQVIAHSGTSGGDNTAVLMDANSGGFFDIGQNPNFPITGLTVTEIADTTLPVLTGTGSINYSTCFLIFEFNETIDATPASEIDLQKIQLIDASDTVIISDFTGASIVAQDEVTVALTITEYKRAYAQIFSGSRGGVGSALKLKLLTSAVHDVAQNNVLEADIQLVEHNDIIVPVVESVSVNYSTGVISIFTE